MACGLKTSNTMAVVGVVEGLPERYDLYYTIKIDHYYSLFNKDHLIKIEDFPEDVIPHEYYTKVLIGYVKNRR